MSSSDTESDEAPEIITLKNSKKQIEKQNKVVEARRRSEAQARNKRNRALDAKIKEEKRVKGVRASAQAEKMGAAAAETETRRLEERMERAMHNAEEDMGATESEDEDMQDVGQASEDEDSEEVEQGLNPDYLPDHYFQNASSLLKTAVKQAEHLEAISKRKKWKAKRRRRDEERILGTRVIRTLQSAAPPPTGRTVPSSSAKRFLRRQLKGDLRSKGWERRSVVVGSMSSRNGPALRFARG